MSESELYSLVGKKNIGICLRREIFPNEIPVGSIVYCFASKKLIASLLG